MLIEYTAMPSPDEFPLDRVGIDAMRQYLSQTEVDFAILFGSHARTTADASSDVDIALRFPDDMATTERFHQRNRIDADLQAYAEAFVDVSDIASLPTPVAYAALRDGHLLTGDGQTVEEYRAAVEREYEATADERERTRKEFLDRLARGDT